MKSRTIITTWANSAHKDDAPCTKYTAFDVSFLLVLLNIWDEIECSWQKKHGKTKKMHITTDSSDVHLHMLSSSPSKGFRYLVNKRTPPFEGVNGRIF